MELLSEGAAARRRLITRRSLVPWTGPTAGKSSPRYQISEPRLKWPRFFVAPKGFQLPVGSLIQPKSSSEELNSPRRARNRAVLGSNLRGTPYPNYGLPYYCSSRFDQFLYRPRASMGFSATASEYQPAHQYSFERAGARRHAEEPGW